MIDLFRRLLAKAEAPSSGEDAHKRRTFVATCALLMEMAAIDGEFSGVEQDTILATLTASWGMDSDEAHAIMEAAKAELEQSVDLWRFARIINREYSEQEKLEVIEAVWRVIYADGRLDGHEDHLVHRLADLLRLSHNRLIEAKMRVRNS